MISNDTIQYVLKNYTRGGKLSAKKVKDHLMAYEPEFFEFLKISSLEDTHKLMEKVGIPPIKEITEEITSKFMGSRIEGYLIHSIAQDKFWSHKYGIDVNNNISAEDKFKLFIDGKLDACYYKFQLTEKEKNDPTNFKNLALQNFKKNIEKLELENELKKVNESNIIPNIAPKIQQVGGLLD